MLIAAFYALGAASLQTGMFGVRGALVLDAMPIWAGYIIAAIFISDRLATGSGSAFELPSDIEEGSIRRTFVLGALIFVIDHALEHVFVFNEVSAASISALHFILILLGAYVLSRATVKLRQAVTVRMRAQTVYSHPLCPPFGPNWALHHLWRTCVGGGWVCDRGL